MSKTFSAELEVATTVKGMVDEARAGLQALRSLAEVGEAAASTGCPWTAGAAITALGGALIKFLVDGVEQLQEDIEKIEKTVQSYRDDDARVATQAQRGTGAVQQFAIA